MKNTRKRAVFSIIAIVMLLLPVLTEHAYAKEKINFSYIYSVSKNDYIKHVDQTNNSVTVIAPNYYDLAKNGSLVTTANFDKNFIREMHNRGVKVVPFLSNHWDKESGINALNQAETLATKIVDEVTKHNLDGINIDMEGLSHKERDAFSYFIKVLAEKMPTEKEISVAVAANTKGLTTGWHGSYDYQALAQHADYLIIMAYDESYSGSDPGPVASSDFVEKSIQYALNQGISSDKIVLGVPFYGRIWRLEDLETKKGVVGDGIWMNKTVSLLDNYGGTYQYDEGKGSFVGRVTIKENDPPFRLFSWKEPFKPGNYEIWFDNEQTIQKKLELVNKYELKGTANWSLGQESPSLWTHYKTWLNLTVPATNDREPEKQENENPNKPQQNNENSNTEQPQQQPVNNKKKDPSQIDVIVNGKEIVFTDQQPIIQAGTTLVPLRGVFEALGASVQWDEGTKEITATDGSTNIWLKANSKQANVNGKITTITVPVQIIEGRTMVPLRFISEAFAAVVNWEAETKTVIIMK